MDRYIKSRTYTVRPRMKTYWFKKDKKVYDIIELVKGEYYSDPSYGNGGGDYVPYEKESILYTCDNITEAETLKTEMLNSQIWT